MDIEIEELNLDDFDLEFFDKDTENDIFNIIYSYPYYNDNKYEYEFRASIKNDNVILDELICDDNTDNFNECIIETKQIIVKPIKKIIELIKENKDIRTENILITNDYIDLDSDDKSVIEENKKNVIADMYKELLEYID